MHDDPLTGAHLGFEKTYAKLRERYFWEGMKADVLAWISLCTMCAALPARNSFLRAPLQSIQVTAPFELLAVDIMGPFPKSDRGNEYVVVFSDYLTRWPEAFAVAHIDAESIAELLVTEIISRHGSPRRLLSDQGTQFTSELCLAVCKVLQTKKLFTGPFRPQTDGLVERFNKTLARMLSMYVNDRHSDWDDLLPFVLFAYRISKHASTSCSPFKLLYGRDPLLPNEAMMSSKSTPLTAGHQYLEDLQKRMSTAHSLALKSVEKSQQSQSKYHDKSLRVKDWQVGDQVLLYRPPRQEPGKSPKFLSSWVGPYKILKKTGPVNFQLGTLNGSPAGIVAHHNHLRLWPSSDIQPRRPTREPAATSSRLTRSSSDQVPSLPPRSVPVLRHPLRKSQMLPVPSKCPECSRSHQKFHTDPRNRTQMICNPCYQRVTNAIKSTNKRSTSSST